MRGSDSGGHGTKLEHIAVNLVFPCDLLTLHRINTLLTANCVSL